MKLDLSKLKQRQLQPHSAATEKHVESVTRAADAEIAQEDKILDHQLPPRIDESTRGRSKLSRLIDDDFPFDESQLAAINGMASERFACMTGAAGTGKTTSLKKLVDLLQESVATVDMETYFKKAKELSADRRDREEGFHDNDDYEVTEQFVPAICLCSFTGRASQMIKKNFPRDWHGNIMTIHRMLAYMPEWYEDYDEETDEIKNKMRFIPTYNEHFKLPWDIVIIDEAGMLGVDLWHNILAALKPGARVYMVGDINQLPPTHGKSVFGFSLASWPSWELTHIHRQTGVNNSIVDNAWRVLKGQTPISDDPKDPSWKFVMMEVPGDPNKANQYIRAWLNKIKGRTYDPIRDTIITPINAYEQCTGYALGQDPLNRQLALMFNEETEENPRYIIDAGRERKYFAAGDKVMATRNDYEAGITNGMTGIITSIARHANYSGDIRRFDTIKNVNRYLQEESDDSDEPEISLHDLSGMMDNSDEEKERQKKESRDRGPASHIVTVQFGEGEHSFEIAFSTLAEVASLMTAYVVTCHKMQGGESPFVIVIAHQSHKRMMFREWLYTAITRASAKCVVLYTKQGLAFALSKQNIKGSTLDQKVQAFQALQTRGIAGAAVNVRLPNRESLSKELVPAANRTMAEQAADKSRENLMSLAQEDSVTTDEPVKEPPVKERIVERIIIVERKAVPTQRPEPAKEPEIIDGGDLTPTTHEERWERLRSEGIAKVENRFSALRNHLQLPAPKPVETRSTYGAVKMMLELSLKQEQKLLTYQPKLEPKKIGSGLGFKLNLKRK